MTQDDRKKLEEMLYILNQLLWAGAITRDTKVVDLVKTLQAALDQT